MSRMVGGIGGAVWAGYGSLLGDEPPHSVAMVLESCPDNRDSGQEWTSGSHRRVRDRRAITKIIAACHVHPRLNIIIGHHQGMNPDSAGCITVWFLPSDVCNFSQYLNLIVVGYICNLKFSF